MPCKICKIAAALFGVVDFNRSCEEVRGKFLPLSGIPIYYRRCSACGFLFSDSFDDWTDAEFEKYIYNDDSLSIDPDYQEARPSANAEQIARLFEKNKSRLRVLDYGSGNGALSSLLRSSGFLAADSYEPVGPDQAPLPTGPFDIVSCFETLEHLPDPLGGIEAIAGRVADSGLVLFSTLIPPAKFDTQKMSWWYIGPRNGHISMFTRRSLAIAWQCHGFTTGSWNDNFHVAFRRVPDFAKHLMPAV